MSVLTLITKNVTTVLAELEARNNVVCLKSDSQLP